MNHLPAKYDFYPGCRAVVISTGAKDRHLLGKVITCIAPLSTLVGKMYAGNTRNVWEVSEEFTWYDLSERKYYKRKAVSERRLMPLPPDEGLILSEEELLLLCVKEK